MKIFRAPRHRSGQYLGFWVLCPQPTFATSTYAGVRQAAVPCNFIDDILLGRRKAAERVSTAVSTRRRLRVIAARQTCIAQK